VTTIQDELKLDWLRQQRTGLPEAVLTAGKSREQLVAIVAQAHQQQRSLLFTRVDDDAAAVIREAVATPQRCDDDRLSRTTLVWHGEPAPAKRREDIVIITAGSSDVPVAREAVRTLRLEGIEAVEHYDAGVAGLWRVLSHVESLQRAKVVICIAGMDSALPSVVGGLVGGLVVAVPTSTGYGVAAGGTTALNAALCACSSGVVVVNIDNGYGAACAALRSLRSPSPV
jgi:pyridinium-3,5-biscarboxylic acid mononucleotide synthase